uniref:Cytochrome P450, family 2, subfamily s, polypeptide 1 n=1 Tax=Jaculus jaculus TaxID=51337 RepID=A0A8C5JVD6_JACJA
MEATGTWALLLALLLLALLLKLAVPRTRARGHLPPGPRPLPLLGNLLQLRPGALYPGLLRLSKKYGPVFTVHLGPWRRVVVLVGYKVVQEALGDMAEEFNGRGMLAMLDQTFDGHGVLFANGERWKQLRKFTLLALRDLGMGKREGEGLIQAEVQCLVEAFRDTEGHPFDPSLLLAQATSNVICSLTFGVRFSYEDEEFRTVVQAASGTLLGISSPWGQAYEMFFRLLRLLPGPHTQVQRHLGTLAAFAARQVSQHQGNRQTSGPARDVVDAFLMKMEQGTEVFPLLGSVLHDPEVFQRPEEFNPDRFLDADGRLKKHKAFLPFSLGKRVCLGEGLVRAELFLFFTAILQAFSLETPCPSGSLSLQPAVSGLFNIPPAFQLLVRPTDHHSR